MKLDQIPTGEHLLLDANIFLYAYQRRSEQCARVLRRCVDQDVVGFAASHIFAEVMHQLMIGEAREKNLITRGNPAKQLSSHPEVIKQLVHYRVTMKDLFAVGIQFESVRKDDFPVALQIQQEAGLLTNDALLVAVAKRLNIQAIASSDKMLAGAKGITVYSPDDLSGGRL